MKIRIPGRNYKKIADRRELVSMLSDMIHLAVSEKKDFQHVLGDDTSWYLDTAENWMVIFYPDDAGVVDIVYKHNAEYGVGPEECLVGFIKYQLNAVDVIENTEPHLPGALVRFTTATCCGSHENSYGVGDMSLALHRPQEEFVWVDLGHIYYSNPTSTQLEDAETSPTSSNGWRARSNIHRRLSRKQAQLVVSKINRMLATEFVDGIPPDDEIQL